MIIDILLKAGALPSYDKNQLLFSVNLTNESTENSR